MKELELVSVKVSEVVELLSTVFISSLERKKYLEKQFVTDEVLRVLEFNGITRMEYTYPAIDRVFNNLSIACNLETLNAFNLK